MATPTVAWQITPQGDRTLLLRFGDQIDVAIGQHCAAAAATLRAAQIAGVTDIVPAFSTVAVHYQPRLFGASTTFQHLTKEIDRILNSAPATPIRDGNEQTSSRPIDIPVCYGGEYGPDLSYVAGHCQLDESEVIRLHSDSQAFVFMLGFAPGAPYIGLHDQKLAIPRRATPRTALPAGSVAIANRQTLIYPNVSPGGWHIIGMTPLVLFDPERTRPSLFSPGDIVRFVPIERDEFLALKKELS